MLAFPQIGQFKPGQITVAWKPSTRLIVADVEEQIARTWDRAMSRPGIHLFDGPMCRLEAVRVAPDGRMHLELSRTSYRPFVGTNLTNAAELCEKYGPRVLASPVGLSCVLLSADGFLLLGRRSANVAYYPSRVHPFAGSLEPADDLDVFADVRRELREELSLGPDEIEKLLCTGITEDRSIRQPEMSFVAKARLTLERIQSQLNPDEHVGIWSIPSDAESVASAMRQTDGFTPVAIGATLLWGRIAFGESWFEEQARRFVTSKP